MVIALGLLGCSLPNIVIDENQDRPLNSQPTSPADNPNSGMATVSTDYASLSPWAEPAEIPEVLAGNPPSRSDVPGQPPILGLGVQLEMTVGVDGALITVEPPSPNVLYLLLTPLTPFDPVVEVREPAGRSVATIDERGRGDPEIINIPLDNLSQLLVVVSGSQSGRDQVRLAVFSSTSDMFDPIFSTEGVVQEDDVNRHRVQLTAGRPVIIRLEPDPDSDLIMELYDSSTIITGVDDGFDGELEQLLFTPQETAEHVLTVYGFQFQGGSYTLTVDQLK